MTRRNVIWGWHFVGADLRLTHDAKDVTVAPGYIYTYEGESLRHCNQEGKARGLFACREAFDALYYANGPVICRVRSWGDVIEDGNKLVSRHREVLAMKNVSMELRWFGCWCVRQIWDQLIDEDSRHAVETAEAYALGKATHKELTTARARAWGAARNASWAAAWTAAWNVTCGDAWVAARDAAMEATWATNWVASKNAAKEAQRIEFERRMLVAMGIKK